MIENLNLLAGFTLGLLGGAHCIGMCGGIMGALSFSIPDQSPRGRLLVLLTYNAGRILSYGMIGALFGSIGYVLGDIDSLRIIAGALMIAMGLYLANWWRGLTLLERGGAILWRRLQPLGKRLMPVKNRRQAFLLGALWGWLPCGLVYSSLAYASTQSSSWQAAAFMVAFGLGTLPAVLAGGLMAETIKSFVQSPNVRIVFSLLIIAFGVWTIYAGLPASHDHHHH